MTLHIPSEEPEVRATIKRFNYGKAGTFGVLNVLGFQCYTVEKPWNNNERRKSCIPDGVYRVEMSYYHRGEYPAYEVMNVPNRDLIKIHRANYPRNVLGCIGLGRNYVKNMVTSSKPTLEKFMQVLTGVRSFELTIGPMGAKL